MKLKEGLNLADTMYDEMYRNFQIKVMKMSLKETMHKLLRIAIWISIGIAIGYNLQF